MDALALDPGDYGGTYKLVGGRVCLDFVNTVSWPLTNHPHDWFDRAANVIEWARAVDLINRTTAQFLARRIGSDPRGAQRAVERMRRQRATVSRVLSPLAHGRTPVPGDVDALNRLLAGAARHRIVATTQLEWTWVRPVQLDEISRPVILDAANVLADSDHSRIGHCPSCHWVFYDTTRNRSRRWCDMADCGSRDKALRYYHRQRGNTIGSDDADGPTG